MILRSGVSIGRRRIRRGAISGVLTAVLVVPVVFTSEAVSRAAPAPAPASPAPTPPAAAEGDPAVPTPLAAPVAPTEILVTYRPSGGDPAAEFESAPQRRRRARLNDRVGSVAVDEISESTTEVVRVADGVELADALAVFRADPTVEFAEPNYRYSTQQKTDDRFASQQWALHNLGRSGGTNDADIDAREAWNLTTGRPTVVVVVIDSGIDVDHPDLAGNVWTNPGEIAGDGVDNDGNGYVDDIHGYDFVDDDGDPADPHGHGTHVAGIIAATGDNGIGVTGVGWNVQVAACRFLNASGSGFTDDAVKCLNYVAALRRSGVDVVATNNSWSGGSRSVLLEQAIRAQQDVLFVAAAGNAGTDLDATPAFPASYSLPNVISVAASDRADGQPIWSNHGHTSVSLSAPGVDIVSLRAPGTDMNRDGRSFVPAGDPDAEYYLASGTSMAAPYVSGVAALVRSHDPDADWRTIKNLILAGADPVAGLEASTVTGGRLNAYGALTCSGRRVFAVTGTAPRFPLPSGAPATFTVLDIDCARPAGPVRATTSNGDEFDLSDDGAAPDVAAGDGVYTATFVPADPTVSVTFTSGAEQVMVPGISLLTYVPQARATAPFRHVLQSSGTAPLRWSILAGTLPAGLRLDPGTGVIAGTPTRVGRTNVVLRVEDAHGRVEIADADIEVGVGRDLVSETLLAHDVDDRTVIPKASTVDADGNTIVVGYYIDRRTRDEDIAVQKYDASGVLLWSRYRQSTTPWWANWANAVAVDAGGDIYVAGGYPYFQSDSDFMVLKYDAAGNETWATSYSNGATEFPTSIAVDPAGDVVVAGQSMRVASDVVALTVKFRPSGELVWAQTFDAQLLDSAAALDIDAAGSIYLVGRSGFVFGVEDGTTLYSYAVLTYKYTASGELVWAHYVDNTGARTINVGRAIVVDDAGNSYTGEADSSVVQKFDPDGTLVWAQPIRFADSAVEVMDIDLDIDGNPVVAGAYFDFGVMRRIYVLVHLDAAGRTIASRRLSGSYSDSGIDVTVDRANVARVTVPMSGGVVVTTFRTALGIATTTLPTGLRGEAYDGRLRSSGGVAPMTWALSSGSLPAGLSLDPATGAVTGVPAAGGVYRFTATVTGADGASVSRSFRLPIAHLAIDAVTVGGPIPIGVPFDLALVARGDATPITWRVVRGAPPPGITLDAATGAVAGTPTRVGSYRFTVRATDAEQHTETVAIALVVYEPLALVVPEIPDAVTGTPYRIAFSAHGGTKPYTWSYWGNPVPGLEVDAVTGEFLGTPTTPGVYETGLFVMDATETWVTHTFTVVVL